MQAATIRELSQTTGIKRKTLARRLNKEGCQHIECRGKGGIEFRYQISSLPCDIRQAYCEKMGIELSDSLLPIPFHSHQMTVGKSFKDTWTDKPAIDEDTLKNRKVKRALAVIRDMEDKPPTEKRRKWAEFIANKHNIHVSTVYDIVKRHDQKGIAGLANRKSTRGKAKTWDDEAIDFGIGLYLKRSHRKINRKELYKILAHEAVKRGWKIGSYESFLWWCNKKATPQLLAMQRGGMRALDNTLPPVLRDYSDLQPFEILVGDQHRFDFWVVDDETGEVFRPEGYAWQDLRTRIIYGAAIDRRYDASLIGLALNIGMNIYGAFGSIYTDNGKPEISRYIIGIMDDMRALGLEWQRSEDYQTCTVDVDSEEINPLVTMPGTHKNAIVKNAKAKMIEGYFDKNEQIIRSVFRLAGSVKRLGDDIHAQDIDHNEAMKLAEQGKLPTFSEFALTMYRSIDYYNRQKDHRGVLKEWMWNPKPKEATPYACLEKCYENGWRPRKVSDRAVNLMFLAKTQRKVDRGRVQFKNDFYEADPLIELHGKTVDIRFNPMKLDEILIFHNRKYICIAEPVVYSSMRNMDHARKKIVEKRAHRKKISEQYREIVKGIPDFRQYSEIPELEKAAALIEGDRKKKAAENAEMYRLRSPEELEAEVAVLEKLNASPKILSKPVPERPSFFLDDFSHFEWCLKYELTGGQLSDDDATWVKDYESKMSANQQEYWQTVREVGF